MAKLRAHDLHVIANFKPTILILEIGTNDFTNPATTVTTLAFAIFHLVQFIHHVFYVPYIINQTFHRARPQRGMCPFNARAAHLNRIPHAFVGPFCTLCPGFTPGFIRLHILFFSGMRSTLTSPVITSYTIATTRPGITTCLNNTTVQLITVILFHQWSPPTPMMRGFIDI